MKTQEETDMKVCIACGMPMTKRPISRWGDESKEYCVYCARPDGSMQSYEERLDGMTGFMVQDTGSRSGCGA